VKYLKKLPHYNSDYQDSFEAIESSPIDSEINTLLKLLNGHPLLIDDSNEKNSVLDLIYLLLNARDKNQVLAELMKNFPDQKNPLSVALIRLAIFKG